MTTVNTGLRPTAITHTQLVELIGILRKISAKTPENILEQRKRNPEESLTEEELVKKIIYACSRSTSPYAAMQRCIGVYHRAFNIAPSSLLHSRGYDIVGATNEWTGAVEREPYRAILSSEEISRHVCNSLIFSRTSDTDMITAEIGDIGNAKRANHLGKTRGPKYNGGRSGRVFDGRTNR